MGLSYNWAQMTKLVDNMIANGTTNRAIGLDLGWISLAGGGPFTAPAMDPNYKYQQVIILLTDGLNTQDRWYFDLIQATQMDARQQITCNNINAGGITLYTVQVNTDGDPTSTLLQNCADSPGKYPDSGKFFLLTSANQIVTTFFQPDRHEPLSATRCQVTRCRGGKHDRMHVFRHRRGAAGAASLGPG